jgi:hypothetical protein
MRFSIICYLLWPAHTLGAGSKLGQGQGDENEMMTPWDGVRCDVYHIKVDHTSILCI